MIYTCVNIGLLSFVPISCQNYQLRVLKAYKESAVVRGFEPLRKFHVDLVIFLVISFLLLSHIIMECWIGHLLHNVQGAAWLLADLNLAPSALRWWEKGGVGIMRKLTARSFVSPRVLEGRSSVRRGCLLFKWPLHYCNSTYLPDPVQYSHWSSTFQSAVDSFMGKHV